MMDTNHVFPFVGPRTFEESDRHLFFGREPEAQDLLSLVMAERFVLFYASSGAGKSSLLNARLRPDLRQAGFALLPLGRVSGSLPDHLGAVDNVFSFNLILSLDQNRHKASSFAHTTLRDYLQARPDQSDQETPYVLMIDQFEEIFSTNLEHWGQREEFFRQLREAMTADSQLWVVLAMREDYVAALDPYARLLPGKLRTRYYMRPLGYEAALAAIRQPAEWGGRPFAAGVAEQLVDNLRQVKLQGQTEVSHLGEFVEPVQLQVVCYRLWQNLTERPLGPITQRDLAEAGDVDTALAQFYEQALVAVTGQTGEAEIEVRTWFESQLITEAGTRGTVYQGETHSGGLANHTAELLAGHHLLRRELRAGGTWYELVHDRMIDPILKANQAWRLKQPLIQIAQAWVDSGHSPNLLLDERQLEEALATKWSALGPLVKAFLEASQENQAAKAEAHLVRKEIRRQQQLRQSRRFATTLALLFVVTLAAAIFAFTQQRRAQWETEQAIQAKAIADANGLALKAKDVLESQPKEGLLLAVKALTTTLTPYQFRVPAAEQVLRQALAEIGGRPLRGYPQDIVAVALSPGRHLLATGSQDGLVRLWDPRTGREVGHLAGYQAIITGLAFSPNDRWLATADEAGGLRLWDLTTDNRPDHTLALNKPAEWITSLVFSPDSTWLATTNNRGAVRLWTLSQPDRPKEVRLSTEPDLWVNQLAFSPDGHWLATSSSDGSARLWRLLQQTVEPTSLLGEADYNLSAISFSADSRHLAAGGFDGRLWLWAVSQSAAERTILPGHEDTISALAFSPDGRWLVTGSLDKTVRLWDLHLPAVAPLILPGPAETVVTLDFSPDSNRLAAGSGNFVILWNLTDPDLLTTLTILRGHSDAVKLVAFGPDSRWLVSSSYDQTVRVWNVLSPMADPHVLARLGQTINTLSFSADSCRLATGSGEGVTRLWNLADLAAAPEIVGPNDATGVAAFSPTGELLARGGPDGTVHIQNMTQPTSQPLTLTGHPKGVTDLAFSVDGQWLGVGCGDNTVRLWPLNQPEATPLSFGQTQHDLTALAFDPAGRWLATGGLRGRLHLWSLAEPTAKPVTLPETGANITALAFSPEGQLAAAYDDNVVRLWDTTGPEPDLTPLSPIGSITSEARINGLAFSPEGHRLAAGSSDHSLRLWAVTEPAHEPILLRGHDQGVLTLAFSPDGRWLASGSKDGVIYLWRLRLSELATLAYEVIGQDQPVQPWSEIFNEPPLRQTGCSVLFDSPPSPAE